jgi:hypothetical protein
MMIARFDMDRDTLYNEVWQAPMIEVGKKHGISRPTVKWACMQMGVPLPPQSYWTHLAHGLRITEQPPLPRRRADQPQTISRSDLLKQERPSRRTVEQRRKTQKIRAEKARLIMEEELRYGELLTEVDDWHRAESIRRYLGELDRRIALGGQPVDGYIEWRAWAERRVKDLDYSNLRVELDEG